MGVVAWNLLKCQGMAIDFNQESDCFANSYWKHAWLTQDMPFQNQEQEMVPFSVFIGSC